jgi:hypothetical protein
MTDLKIQSEGPPPEAHARRIILNMMRHLARENATLWNKINIIVHDPFARDGNPKAQQRLADKVKALGAAHVSLQTGKRGKYTMFIHDIIGWNRDTDKPIGVDDEVENPWLAAQFHTVEGLGRCRIRHYTRQVLFISAHSLVRVVQRWQARTLDDLLRVIHTITAVGVEYIIKIDDGTTSDWAKTPLDGVRVPFPNNSSVMVLKQYEVRPALVVITIF